MKKHDNISLALICSTIWTVKKCEEVSDKCVLRFIFIDVFYYICMDIFTINYIFVILYLSILWLLTLLCWIY